MRPPGRRDQAVDFVEEDEDVLVQGKIERERESFAWKRHQPGGRRTELFQHGEEGGVAARRDAIENLADRILRLFGRHDALMLKEAVRAIDPVPIANRIERKEERIGCCSEMVFRPPTRPFENRLR